MSIALSVVVPIFNEREAAVSALLALAKGLERAGIHSYEIVAVDDGSTDGTYEQLLVLMRDAPGISALRHETNRGQAVAILTGMASACGEVVTHNAVDLPFDPNESARALKLLDLGADVVVVERADRTAYGPGRQFVSLANIGLQRLLLRSPFHDHNFVQFYRREVLQSVDVRSRGVSTVTPELILRARRLGFRVVTMTAPYRARTTGRSSVTWRKIARATGETIHLCWLMRLPDRRDSQSSPPSSR